MDCILPLLFGLLIAFIGVIPPGLINMTAAKVNFKEGKQHAYYFVCGALIIVMLQTYLAILFAKLINKSPDLIIILREVGFILFSLLSVYFFWSNKKAKIKKPKVKPMTSSKRFLLGILLSALNFFPIPYYGFCSVTLASYGMFDFSLTSILFFVFGVTLGSGLVFYIYIEAFQRIEKKADYLLQNMNMVIGSITGLIALATLIHILKFYF
jgi:threonine/homoserine/homoserine lactone efflux protein